MKRFVSSLLLAALLLTATGLPATAADYSDLPSSHWAYEEMSYAAWLGLINGVGGGQMAPSAPLTRGQFLPRSGPLPPSSTRKPWTRGLPGTKPPFCPP